ncbi:isocitrate lyase/PEP mutase family protein [Rhodococcus rhodochrous]|nr:isocitrate lyase/PEP mutase family protein [Rhodococcus rhodochrous]
MMETRRTLRRLLEGPGAIVVPGAYDSLSAVLVQQAGFEAVYMSGYAVSAALLGMPDLGLLTGSEMVDNSRRMASAIRIPLIVDGDTGYGNALNVRRTVQTYEQAGVAAIQLEDQVTPKRCGHMSGKQVIDRAEMVGKIRAAVEARRDPDLMIVGRTDAASIEGTNAAIIRAKAYADAGADILFVEAPDDVREIEVIAAGLNSAAPLVYKVPEGRPAPPLSFGDLADLGFSIILMPIGTLLAATAGMQRSLRELSTNNSPVDPEIPSLTFGKFNDLMGLPTMQELEKRYAD